MRVFSRNKLSRFAKDTMLRICVLGFVFCFALLTPCRAQQAFTSADQTKYAKAVESSNKGRYVESNRLLRELNKKYPSNADVYYYLGFNAAKQEANVAAIRRYFAQLRRVSPNYPNAVAHYYWGVIHYTDEHFDDAVAEFTRFFDIANAQGTPETDALYAEASNYLYWSQFLADAYRNVAPFSPYAVKGVSTSMDEMLPFFTWDESQAYYLRLIPTESNVGSYYKKDIEDVRWRLHCSPKKDSLFTQGFVLPAPFNQTDNEGGVTLTADNNTLYYSILRKQKGYNNCDIYYAQRIGNEWGPVTNCGPAVNGENSWESQPSVTPDGQWLYFASNRKGGLGGTDIWRCRKTEQGWSEPQNLGPAVNTAGNEKSPFIHADGHTLYFASNGWQGFGGYDMYFVDLSDTANNRPTNMGVPINTDQDDICFGVTADGLRAYYAGYAPDNSGMGRRDVMMFDLYPTARPERMGLVKGVVMDDHGNPLQAEVIVGNGYARYHTDAEGRFAILLPSEGGSVTFKSSGKADYQVSSKENGSSLWKITMHNSLSRPLR